MRASEMYFNLSRAWFLNKLPIICEQTVADTSKPLQVAPTAATARSGTAMRATICRYISVMHGYTWPMHGRQGKSAAGVHGEPQCIPYSSSREGADAEARILFRIGVKGPSSAVLPRRDSAAWVAQHIIAQ